MEKLTATDTKATDTKTTDTKAADTKATDTKATKAKAAKAKATDTKATKAKATDTKATDKEDFNGMFLAIPCAPMVKAEKNDKLISFKERVKTHVEGLSKENIRLFCVDFFLNTSGLDNNQKVQKSRLQKVVFDTFTKKFPLHRLMPVKATTGKGNTHIGYNVVELIIPLEDERQGKTLFALSQLPEFTSLFSKTIEWDDIKNCLLNKENLRLESIRLAEKKRADKEEKERLESSLSDLAATALHLKRLKIVVPAEITKQIGVIKANLRKLA